MEDGGWGEEQLTPVLAGVEGGGGSRNNPEAQGGLAPPLSIEKRQLLPPLPISLCNIRPGKVEGERISSGAAPCPSPGEGERGLHCSSPRGLVEGVKSHWRCRRSRGALRGKGQMWDRGGGWIDVGWEGTELTNILGRSWLPPGTEFPVDLS